MTEKSVQLKQRNAPMNKARLKEIVTEYASKFPEWELAHGGLAFIRNSGPIEQMVWFQDMRKYYRPTHGIISLVLPQARIRMLPQVLDVKHREVEHFWHKRKFADTLTAIEQQFSPDLRKPLDIAEVLALCEAEARSMQDTTNNVAMLAILYAWLDRNFEALDCCERMQHCPLPKLAPMPEWEEAMHAFGRSLSRAVEAGTARELLKASIIHAKNN